MSLFHAQSQLMLPKSGELGTEAEMFFFFFPRSTGIARVA